MTFPPIVDLNPEKQRSGMLRIADYWTTLKGTDMKSTVGKYEQQNARMHRTTVPTRDQFEAELTNVLRQRPAEHYEIACRRDQHLFLVCVGTVAVTGFLCACLLWTILP